MSFWRDIPWTVNVKRDDWESPSNWMQLRPHERFLLCTCAQRMDVIICRKDFKTEVYWSRRMKAALVPDWLGAKLFNNSIASDRLVQSLQQMVVWTKPSYNVSRSFNWKDIKKDRVKRLEDEMFPKRRVMQCDWFEYCTCVGRRRSPPPPDGSLL